MKTGFLFKAKPNLSDVTIEEKQGIYFTTVTSDLRFLDNIVISAPDYDLRLFVKQQVNGQFVGEPILWILLLTEHCVMDNVSYEKAWNITSEFCSKLFPYIKMGIVLNHEQAWVYPNIPLKWDISQTLLDFKSVQGVGLFWDDPDGELYEEDGETKKRIVIKSIKADLVTVINSEKILQQSHTIHITIPSTNIQANKKDFHLEKDILDKIQAEGFDYLSNNHEIQLLRLYSSAICLKDFFASFLLFYQIIEYIEKKIVQPTKLSREIKNKLKKFISSDEELNNQKERLMGAIGNIKQETSYEMLEKGLIYLINESGFSELELSDDVFKGWRHTRGDLSHAEKQVQITQSTFFVNYSSIRKFCTSLVHTLLRQKGFDI